MSALARFQTGYRLFSGEQMNAIVDRINGAGGTGVDPRSTSITTAGAGTLTAAGIVGGLIVRSGPTAVFTDTTATAAAIKAAMTNPTVGTSWYLTIKNTTAFAETLVGGTGVTLSGNKNVIPGLSVGTYLVTLATATTVTIQGMSAQSLTDGGPPVSTALTTVGAGTITAAGIVGGVTARGGAQSATPFADTTATADQIIAAKPNANIGGAWFYTYRNNTNAAATVGGGTGVTVSGVTVIGQNSWVQYLVTYTAASTVTMVGIAAGQCTLQRTQAAVATADNGTTQTLTAAMVIGANQVFHVSTGGTTPSLTLPLATAMDTAMPDLQAGQSFLLRVINNNSGTATMVTNTGWTTSGTLTLATNTTRDFVITKTATGAYTFTSVGTGANS